MWLAILSQFAAYVEGHAENFRSKLVRHSEKVQLTVSEDATTLQTANVERLSTKITELMKSYLRDDWAIPSFTTTTNTDRAVGSHGSYKGILWL